MRKHQVLFLIVFFLHTVYSIMGGRDINIIDAPHHVGYGDLCSGVLIHHQWALTTAHCGFTTDSIRIGSSFHEKGYTVNVTRHLVHPRYREQHDFDFDIQLLELRRPLSTNRKRVKHILIRRAGARDGDKILVTGWGYGKEKGYFASTLQRVELNFVSFDRCQLVEKPWYNHTLTPRMFCAEGTPGKDACQGDSGGGAVLEGKLLGLSSFGFGCGRVPGVYTNLTDPDIRDWIDFYVDRGADTDHTQ